jgi:uncharacterized protein GlcG (DUF336 family)
MQYSGDMECPPAHRTGDIALGDARVLIDRAVAKAEEIGMRGAIAVVGGSGALVSASRMDHGGAGGMARARSKAWIAATQQISSLEHLKRMGMVAPPMVTGFVACSPEAVFPGAGGMPIRRDGWVIGALAASGAGIGPFVNYPGADPEKLTADGRPANGEDLLVHYALGLPYEGQHGDDEQRWLEAYGSLPSSPGRGMADPVAATRQREHAWARALSDRALAVAAERGVAICVAIVDHRGEPIQQDRMDGAPTAAITVAEAAAATAATFQCRSDEVAEHFADGVNLDLLAAALPYRILAVAGGLPVSEAGAVVAGIGVGGPPPPVSAEIAAAALA